MKVDDIAPLRRRNLETGGIDAENAFIAGITRSGKTYLAKQLALRDKYTVVHDAKGTFTFPLPARYHRIRSVSELDDLDPEEHTRIVYSPVAHELRDEGAQDAFFEWAYTRGGTTTVVIDELKKVCSKSRILPHLADLYSRGNEFGISVIGLSQEPMNIHSEPISQASHLYCFYIAIETHRVKMMSVMPIEYAQLANLNPHKHTFYYWRTDLPEARGPMRFDGKQVGIVTAAKRTAGDNMT